MLKKTNKQNKTKGQQQKKPGDMYMKTSSHYIANSRGKTKQNKQKKQKQIKTSNLYT